MPTLPLYNEPLESNSNDVFPDVASIDVLRLGRLVRARLELESAMSLCPIGPSIDLRISADHRAVLALMLSERDSPKAAGLRATAAEWAGVLELSAAAPQLRAIALDDSDDLRTRLSAIRSYARIAGDDAADILRELMASPVAEIRFTAIDVAVRPGRERSSEIGMSAIESEPDPAIRSELVRRNILLRKQFSTTADEYDRFDC